MQFVINNYPVKSETIFGNWSMRRKGESMEIHFFLVTTESV